MDNTKELFDLMSKVYGELQETKKEIIHYNKIHL